MTDTEILDGLIEAIEEDIRLMIKIEHKGLFITIHQKNVTTVTNDANLRYALEEFIKSRKEIKKYVKNKR